MLNIDSQSDAAPMSFGAFLRQIPPDCAVDSELLLEIVARCMSSLAAMVVLIYEGTEFERGRNIALGGVVGSNPGTGFELDV